MVKRSGKSVGVKPRWDRASVAAGPAFASEVSGFEVTAVNSLFCCYLVFDWLLWDLRWQRFLRELLGSNTTIGLSLLHHYGRRELLAPGLMAYSVAPIIDG